MKTIKFNKLSLHMQYKAIKLMSETGSNFAGKLADLYQVADLNNQEILYKSFRSTFDQFANEAKNLYGFA